jgi:hypothetical protein
MMHPSCAGMVGKLARKPIKRPRDRHAAGKADELSRRMITGSPRRLVDESPGQETTLAASEEFDNRRKALADALDGRDRRIFEGRRLAGDPITLAELADELACRVSACARSRCAPSRRCRRRSRTALPRWKPRRPWRCISFPAFAPGAFSPWAVRYSRCVVRVVRAELQQQHLKRERFPGDLLRAPFRGGRVPRPFWSD